MSADDAATPRPQFAGERTGADVHEPTAYELVDDETEDTGMTSGGFGPEVVPGGRRVHLVGGDTIGNSGP